MGVEDRCQDRYVARVRLRYGITGLDREDEAGNVSEGGLYIACHQVFKVGTRLRLAIELGQQTAHNSGQVVWAIPAPEHMRGEMMCGMGIQFLETAPDWLECFRDWRAEQRTGHTLIVDRRVHSG